MLPLRPRISHTYRGRLAAQHQGYAQQPRAPPSSALTPPVCRAAPGWAGCPAYSFCTRSSAARWPCTVPSRWPDRCGTFGRASWCAPRCERPARRCLSSTHARESTHKLAGRSRPEIDVEELGAAAAAAASASGRQSGCSPVRVIGWADGSRLAFEHRLWDAVRGRARDCGADVGGRRVFAWLRGCVHVWGWWAPDERAARGRWAGRGLAGWAAPEGGKTRTRH